MNLAVDEDIRPYHSMAMKDKNLSSRLRSIFLFKKKTHTHQQQKWILHHITY